MATFCSAPMMSLHPLLRRHQRRLDGEQPRYIRICARMPAIRQTLFRAANDWHRPGWPRATAARSSASAAASAKSTKARTFGTSKRLCGASRCTGTGGCSSSASRICSCPSRISSAMAIREQPRDAVPFAGGGDRRPHRVDDQPRRELAPTRHLRFASRRKASRSRARNASSR